MPKNVASFYSQLYGRETQNALKDEFGKDYQLSHGARSGE